MTYLRAAGTLFTMLSLAVVGAQGQAGTPGIKVNVPFRFSIGRTAFAVGQYSILSSGEKIWVQEASGRNVAVAFAGALSGRVPERDGKVVFDCYVGECFLSEVWIAGQEAGRELPKSKRQVQLAKTGSEQQIVLLGTNPRS